MSSYKPECIWPVGATLGEGVLWHAPEQRVYFVDIKSRRIHSCAPDGSERRSWDTPQQVSFIVPAEGGGFVVGMEDGLYRFGAASGQLALLRKVEAELPGNRFNDGYVDAAGRLWFGSMDDAQQAPTGALYRYGGHGEPVKQDAGYIITNGPGTSPCGRTLYHTDTLGKRTYAFDLAPDGSLGGKRVFATFPENAGHPDGMAVDAEGCVWIAVFRGWRIDRFAPDGRKIDSIRFPCSNITKLAFAGDDLRTVYVTTARKGLSEEELAEQPLAGALFTFRADVPGLPQHVLRLQE
jgi:sugar lactone lactonase YvrE